MMKPLSDKYNVATAKLIVQTPPDAEPVDFESLIANEPGLRPTSAASSRAGENVTEVAIGVEYGPVTGSLEPALLTILRRLAKQRWRCVSFN
jgi:hypothetical protein